MPVLRDYLPELAHATIFSVVDLRHGYWHVRLDHDSSLLTTFNTPFGRYRWKVLPFGLKVSAEIFQKRLYVAVGDLPGVINIADDLLIYGSSIEDHDAKLEKLLKRCLNTGIRLNPQKMKLRLTSVPFMGHVLTDEGMKPDPEKVEAIISMPPPEDVDEVHRLCGMVNFLAEFVPSLASIMSPITQLKGKNVPFNWSSSQQKAFESVKRMLSEAPVLKYFEDGQALEIQCDASQKGLGCVLLQDNRPVAYGSRAMTEVETRYAQIEKELLAIVFAMEKFYHYTYGRHITVWSDHKPLELILGKPLHKAPRRLQNMCMRLQRYSFDVYYRKGKEMEVADTLSRAYLPMSTKCGPQDDLQLVHMSTYLPVTDRRFAEIRRGTDADPTLTALRKVILTGWPEERKMLPAGVSPYFDFRDELAVIDGVVMRGDRVVIPHQQRAEMIQKIHQAHSGISGAQQKPCTGLGCPPTSRKQSLVAQSAENEMWRTRKSR
jgi:hypothetical protein